MSLSHSRILSPSHGVGAPLSPCPCQRVLFLELSGTCQQALRHQSGITQCWLRFPSHTWLLSWKQEHFRTPLRSASEPHCLHSCGRGGGDSHHNVPGPRSHGEGGTGLSQAKGKAWRPCRPCPVRAQSLGDRWEPTVGTQGGGVTDSGARGGGWSHGGKEGPGRAFRVETLGADKDLREGRKRLRGWWSQARQGQSLEQKGGPQG